MNLHIEMILNLKTRQHRLKLYLRSFSEVLNLFITVAHFHFENIPMGLYQKFLQTLKRTQKKVIASDSAIFCYVSNELKK